MHRSQVRLLHLCECNRSSLEHTRHDSNIGDLRCQLPCSEKLFFNLHTAEDAEMDAFRELVGGAKNLPEQLFGDSWLQLQHESSGLCLRFDAAGALRRWRADNLPPLQVAHAQLWQRSRTTDIQANNIAALQYDW